MAKADLEKARELYPSCNMGIEEWTSFFGTAAGLRAMGRIIYDIFDEIMSREEREQGKRRIGRRPAREAVSLAKVMAVVKPEEFTNEPLPEALRKLLRGRSQRQFCRKVPISQPYLSRLLSGERSGVDLDMLERLAAAAGVHPWHFPEWRALYVGELITEVMRTAPHVGITVLRSLRTSRREYESTPTATKAVMPTRA
jgi:transcriptional regulator with XRE-family HTH domain